MKQQDIFLQCAEWIATHSVDETCNKTCEGLGHISALCQSIENIYEEYAVPFTCSQVGVVISVSAGDDTSLIKCAFGSKASIEGALKLIVEEI